MEYGLVDALDLRWVGSGEWKSFKERTLTLPRVSMISAPALD